MQFGWIVQGPGSFWVGDGTTVRNFRLARVFHDPTEAKSHGRHVFPKGNLILHYLEAQPVASTTYAGGWEDHKQDEEESES